MIGINVPDILCRLHDLEQAVAQLQRGAAATTPQAPEATDDELRAIWAKPCSFIDSLRAAYNLGRQHGSAAPPAPEPTPEPTPVFPPTGCAVPNWESCRRALAQELPAPAGGLLDQVTAAIAKAHANRFPDEQYRSDAQWAVRAMTAFLEQKGASFTARKLWEDAKRG